MADIQTEQIEVLKEWWHKYGNLTVAIVAVIAITVFAWQFWQNRQVSNATQASLLYEQMQTAIAEKKPGEMEFIADRLMQDYSRTPYAALAGLSRAQGAVQNNDFAIAAKNLQWVVDHAKDKTIAQIARIRLARVLIAQQQAKQALKVLKSVDDKLYLPVINTVRGDAYTALNKSSEAQAAYQEALAGLTAESPIYKWVEMKLENNK